MKRSEDLTMIANVRAAFALAALAVVGAAGAARAPVTTLGRTIVDRNGGTTRPWSRTCAQRAAGGER
jgi:hypothetical protein